ncbi:MAG: peroxidase family protein [Caldilineaceae bacterium]
MSQKHGSMAHYIVGEGFVGPGKSGVNGHSADAVSLAANAPAQPDATRAFRFSRMFPDLPRFRPADEGLIKLGLAMEDSPELHDHPSLPAGYTYFGQFVDHDITRDLTDGLPSGVLTEEEIEQGRSPSLDLDSLYGRGPYREVKPLYEADNIRLRIGHTTPFGAPGTPEGAVLPNDLPRDAQGKAIIGDPRNDEHLAVAQTHLAFLKLHNVVAAQLASLGYFGHELFKRARLLTTLHYQWIVLHDFLPRVIDPAVLKQVMNADPSQRIFQVEPGEEPTMPVEFSVAAYRLGHSMVRNVYNWNRVFPEATLDQLFQFAGLAGDLGGLPTLPSTWPIDWRRFYDYGDALGAEAVPPLNHARAIDTALALKLSDLPEFAGAGHLASLAVRNLLRARLLGLPTGQDVATVLEVEALTPAQLCHGPHGKIIQKYGFDTQTPLWYYILKEAEVLTDGQRLGPVGSRIIAETFVGLIEGSRTSILAPEYRYWRPMLPAQRPGHFTMADMLLLVNELNPLGAGAEAAAQPVIHVVKPGETLRMIANQHYGDESKWPVIFRPTVTTSPTRTSFTWVNGW